MNRCASFAALFIAAICIMISASPRGLFASASPVNPTFEVVAYFEKDADFGSSLQTFEQVYSKVLQFPESPDNVPKTYRRNCDGVPSSLAAKCSMAVGYTNTDGDLMSQLSRKVQDENARNSLIQMILDRNEDFGVIRIGAMAVVPLYTSDPSKNKDDADSTKGFIAKYPYVIAAIAVAVVIAVIVAAVILIQKRANAMAELDDESMLAEGEAPGYVPHANRASQRHKPDNKNNSNKDNNARRGGENEAVVITSSDGKVIGGEGGGGNIQEDSASSSYRPPAVGANGEQNNTAHTNTNNQQNTDDDIAAAVAMEDPTSTAAVDIPSEGQ